MGIYLEEAKLLCEDYVSTRNKNTFYLNGRSGAVDIQVRSDEGNYEPHMHLKILNSGEVGCIKIASPEYFNHKLHHTLHFNGDQAKEFNKWMKKTNSLTGLSNFKTIVHIWNSGKGNNFKLDSDMDQPDYSLLS